MNRTSSRPAGGSGRRTRASRRRATASIVSACQGRGRGRPCSGRRARGRCARSGTASTRRPATATVERRPSAPTTSVDATSCARRRRRRGSDADDAPGPPEQRLDGAALAHLGALLARRLDQQDVLEVARDADAVVDPVVRRAQRSRHATPSASTLRPAHAAPGSARGSAAARPICASSLVPPGNSTWVESWSDGKRVRSRTSTLRPARASGAATAQPARRAPATDDVNLLHLRSLRHRRAAQLALSGAKCKVVQK